jgi:hypothetical protein
MVKKLRCYHGEVKAFIEQVMNDGSGFFVTDRVDLASSLHVAANRLNIRIRTRRIHRAAGFGYDVKVVNDDNVSDAGL